MQNNISKELKTMLSIVKNKELTSIEKYTKLVELQNSDSNLYDIKQVFACKNLLNSSVSISSFLMDIDLFFMLEKEDLLNFKDIKNIKTDHDSMSVIIPLLLLKKDITKIQKQSLLQEWIKKDKVVWNEKYTVGSLESSSHEITNKKIGEKIFKNNTNIFQMLAYFNCYDTISYIVNNKDSHNEMQFKSLRSGVHSRNLLHAFLDYEKASTDEEKQPHIIKINILTSIGDIAYPVHIYDMDDFSQKALFTNKKYSEEVLIDRMISNHSASQTNFDTNSLLTYLKKHIDKFNPLLLKNTISKHVESNRARIDLKYINKFVLPYCVKKEKEMLHEIMNSDIITNKVKTRL